MNLQPILAVAAETEINMVTVITLAILFAALLIACIFYSMGKRAGSAKASPAPATPAVTFIPASPTVYEIPEEVIAVISAAVAAMSEDGKQYAIRRIRPAVTAGSRSTWATAGIAENTRPF